MHLNYCNFHHSSGNQLKYTSNVHNSCGNWIENTPKVHIGHRHKEFGKSLHGCYRSYCSSENQVEKTTDEE